MKPWSLNIMLLEVIYPAQNNNKQKNLESTIQERVIKTLVWYKKGE